MMAIPTLETGWVVGAIFHASADGPDGDLAAEAAVNVGTVTFEPKVDWNKYDARTAITHGPITALLDSQGDIHPQRAVADTTGTDSEDGISLPVGTYTVTYSLNRGALPSHDITVTRDHTPDAPLALFATLDEPPPTPPPGSTFQTVVLMPDPTYPGLYLIGSLSYG